MGDDGNSPVRIVRGVFPLSGLNDARLLGGDLLDSVAQVIHMIHADRADNRHFGTCHRRRIPASAHPHFCHDNIYGSISEAAVGHRGKHFELGHAWSALLH